MLIAPPTFAANDRPAQQNLGFVGTSMTFTAITGTGMVLVGIGWRVNAGTITVSLNGSAMTKAAESAQLSNGQADLWYLAGQTANAASSIVVTCSNSAAQTQIVTATLTNVTSIGTPAVIDDNSAADPHTFSAITIPATGFGVCVGYCAADFSSAAGGGLVQDYGTDNTGANWVFLMHTASTGSVTGSYNTGGHSADNAAVFVPFGP